MPLYYYKLTSFTTDAYGHGDFKYKINDEDLPNGTYKLQIAINHAADAIQIGSTVVATQYDINVVVD